MESQATQSTSAESCSGRSCWWKKSLIAIVVIAAALVAVIAMQPGEFKVARSTTINAPPEAVFAQVNDFRNWETWSPWLELDPKAKETFEGPSVGEGAIFRWDGDSNVGAGSMTLVESKPDELIRIRLDFIRPMEGTSDVQFLFKPEDDGTEVTWSMEGKNSFMAKAISLCFDCDKYIGEQYDKGLANLKKVVEAAP